MSRLMNSKNIFRIIIVISVFALIAGVVFCIFGTKAFANNGEYVEGQAIVCVKGGANALNSQQNLDALKSKNASENFSVEESLMTLETDSTIQKAIGNDSQNFRSLTMPQNLACHTVKNSNEEACEILLVNCANTNNFVSAAKNLDCVMWAQPNYIRHEEEFVETARDDASQALESEANFETNDPYYGYQWALKNTNYGKTSDICAEQAWDAQKGATKKLSDPIVAVIDGGVDYNHEDLASNMWTGGEHPELLALGGGKFGLNAFPGMDTSDPMDNDSGHGTHCASAISSEANNGKGVIGVNGTGGKIMACKFMTDGDGPDSAAIKCFNYLIKARQLGENVVCTSNSWGSTVKSWQYNYALEAVVTEAGLNGILSCFSAGNDSHNTELWGNRLTESPYAIYVGASNDIADKASFSNWGQHTVDVFAPGVDTLCAVSGAPDASGSWRYMPWLHNFDSEVDYYNEKFVNPSSSNVSLSAHIKNGSEISTSMITDQPGQLGINLTNCNVGDDVCVKASIPKSAISTAQGHDPFLGILFRMQDISQENYRVALRYQNDENEDIPISTTYVSTRNTNYGIASTKPTDFTFLDGLDGDNINVEINFVVANKGGNPALFFENIGLGKKQEFYGYKSGTSMAAPIVAGMISNLSMFNTLPDKTSGLKLAAYVKGGVSFSDNMLDKSICPGVVNLASSYKGIENENLLHPVIDSANFEFQNNGDIKAILQGWFFGEESSSSLLINDIMLTCESWTSTQITATIPKAVLDSISPNEFVGEFKIYKDNATENFGRNYFVVPRPTKGYIDLPMSDFSYSDDRLPSFKATNINPLHVASTKDSLFAIFGDWDMTYGSFVAEKFNYASQTWSQVDISSLNVYTVGTFQSYSIASANDEIYFLYPKIVGSGFEYYLATYNDATSQFVSDVNVNSIAHEGDMIGQYNGKLMLIGRNKNANSRSAEVVSIFPDTGNISGEFGNLPLDDLDLISGGNISVFDNKLYITDACSNFWSEDKDYTRVAPLMFDGTTWTELSGDIYSDESGLIDEAQDSYSASFAVDAGLISVGPVKNNAKTNMIDNFILNLSSNDSWSEVDSVRFNPIKVKTIASVAHGNNYYVFGQNELRQGISFRYLPLSSVGLTSQDVTTNAKKEFAPAPPPDPSNDNYNTASTGDASLPLILIALLALLAGTIVLATSRNN